MRLLAILWFCWLAASCSKASLSSEATNSNTRIVSLDYCADQYVLGLADPTDIAALSPDATASFSYLRTAAQIYPHVRPRAEDILLLKPDIVVRTYGGGANISSLLERAGIEVVQIGYAGDLDGVKQLIRNAATELEQPEKGRLLIAQMEQRLDAVSTNSNPPSVLYLTSKGAVAGAGTLIDDLIHKAGLTNYQTRPGWTTIPLENLVTAKPDIVATGFFETSDLVSDIWSSARHPLTQQLLAETETVNLPGAWTACGAWFLLDAVEALAATAKTIDTSHPS